MNNGEFEKVIDYTFKNKALLDKALTHSSFCRNMQWKRETITNGWNF